MKTPKMSTAKKVGIGAAIGTAIGLTIQAIRSIFGAEKDSTPSKPTSNARPDNGGSSDSGDRRTVEKVNKAHPKIRPAILRFIGEARAAGINLVVTSSLRTFEEQQRLYNQGRTTPGGRVTNAKPGESFHNYGLAIDVVEIKDGKANWNADWSRIAEIGKRNGFEWGGDFKTFVDKPHFQMRFGKKHQELKALVDAGKVDRDGYVIL